MTAVLLQPTIAFETKLSTRYITTPMQAPASPLSPRPILPRLEILSPVNQNGSFDFDRVLKSGEVMKRSRRTKQWKRFHLVLRPKLLSFYKNSSEDKLHKQISLSDLTAVAVLKDPKGRRNHIFGLFTPSRNYQFQADNDAEARNWVAILTSEARIDEDEGILFSSSPAGESPSRYSAAMQLLRRSTEPLEEEDDPASSPELTSHEIIRSGVQVPIIRKTSFNENDFSGNELASHSDYSDPGMSRARGITSATLSGATSRPSSSNQPLSTSPVSPRPTPSRNGSQISTRSGEEEERVIWSGYLLSLRSKGGVRQWKKLWVVVRPKHVALYKSEEEYAARLIVPMNHLIDAVEIDPLSRSKAHCFQMIAEDKNYRFCASDDQSLSRCMGALKSQLARRKERRVFMAPPRQLGRLIK